MMPKELVEAAKNGDLDRVRHCVKQLGIPVDSRYPPNEGPTALYWAACNGYDKLCDWLIRHDADPDAILPNSGSTPLHAASDRGHYNCVLTLICSGSQVNRQTTNNGDTPLHLAAYRNYPSVCRLLMEHGANMQIVNKQDRTPLDEACLRSNLDVIQLMTKNLENKLNSTSGNTIFRDKGQFEGKSKDKVFYPDDRIGIQQFDTSTTTNSYTSSHLRDSNSTSEHPTTTTTTTTSADRLKYISSSQGRSAYNNVQNNNTTTTTTMSKRIEELETLVKTLSDDVMHKNIRIAALILENQQLKRKLNCNENTNKK